MLVAEAARVSGISQPQGTAVYSSGLMASKHLGFGYVLQQLNQSVVCNYLHNAWNKRVCCVNRCILQSGIPTSAGRFTAGKLVRLAVCKPLVHLLALCPLFGAMIAKTND